MKNRDTEELKALIEARVETAKENGEKLTKEQIIKEFDLNDDEVKQLSAGVTTHSYYGLW